MLFECFEQLISEKISLPAHFTTSPATQFSPPKWLSSYPRPTLESEPPYQTSVQDTGQRTFPDVAFDADPISSGPYVYSSSNYISATNYFHIYGGTSFAAPCWAGLIAIADQQRVACGGTPLTGSSQTLPALYDLPSADFNHPADIYENYYGVNGTNTDGLLNTSRYDEVTGLGTPVANLLVPALAQYSAPTSITVASLANPSVNGQVVTFTATVTSEVPGSGSPTGDVQFMVDGENLGSPIPLSDGMGIITGIALTSGSDTVTANYINSDGGFINSSVSLAGGQQVNAVTTGNLQSAVAQSLQSGNPIFLEADPTQSVSLTTILSAANGLQTPGSPATITVDLQGGTYTDQTVSPSLDLNLVIQNGTIVGASPALTVGISQGQVQVQNVTLTTSTDSPTIQVLGGGLTLLNDIVHQTNGGTVAAIALTGGSLDLGTAANPGGNTLNINGTGEFLEDPNLIPVPDAGNVLEVNGTPLSAPYLSLITIGTSVSSSLYGQPVTFTASILAANPADGTPTGSVTFFDTSTGSALGSAPITNGVATLTDSSLSIGTHTITANYQGDVNFAFSLSNSTQTVQQDGTTTTISAAPSSSVYGQAATFTATLSVNAPGSGTPTGTVTFFDGAVNPSDQIGTGTLSTSSSGVTTATFSTASLPAGTYAITAVYGGDTDDEGSTSSVVSQSITPEPLVIMANNQAKVYGQTNPALTVSYSGFVNRDTSANLTTLPTVTTTGTTASPVGSYPITASGAVDPNYTISYVAGMLTINTAALTVIAANKSMTYGSAVPALTYTYIGLVNGDTSATFSGGLATSATSSSSVGGYPITQGTLAATGNYTISIFNPGTLTINKAATGTMVVSSANPSVYGQAVTFTATVTNTSSDSTDVPTGTVQFVVDGSNFGTRSP